MKRKIVKCPICRAEIEIPEDTERGDILYCEECDREFKVVSFRPIKLDLLERDEDGE